MRTISRKCNAELPSELKWHDAIPGLIWDDGTQILTAVECCDHRDTTRTWIEYDVVTIRCDEYYFSLECNNEPWGWEYDSIVQFALLSGRVQGFPK